MNDVKKIWTVRGLESGRVLDGWFAMGEDNSCPIDVGYLESQEAIWNEPVVIQLGYGLIKDNESNVGNKWFYETKEETIDDN